MKRKFSFLFFGLMAILFGVLMPLAAFAGVPPEAVPSPDNLIDAVKGVQDWSELLSLETAIYTAVFTVGGYLSAFIPGLKNIDSGTWRVLVFAILVIAGSAVLGIGNIWLGAISYFFSTSLYEVVLKWFVKSPKPVEK